MALVDLKSNLANFRSDFKTPSVESQAVKRLNQPTAVKDTFRPTDSRLDVDSIPASYNKKTLFTKSFVDKSLFDRADDFILKYTGRTTFTKKFINTSKFNIDSTLLKFSATGISKLSNKGIVNTSRFNVDSTPSKFTTIGVSKLSNTKIINKSLFNIDSTPNKFSAVGVSKLSNKAVIDSSLYNLQIKPSKFSSTGIYIPSKFNTTKAVNVSKFNIDSTPAKFSIGGKKPSKLNSNSRIDSLYKKFNEQHNLRDDAFNFSYIRHPLILRGIQRKEKPKPNRWGVDALVNFDSGLMRGGITAVLDRAVADTARIAKWMASPKGLLWVVKQVGLGITNPKVEAIGGILTRQTRIHTGVASLLSVPGTALGLHFTRHGIPFANETASYEKVIKEKQRISVLKPYSRLIELKEEFATGKSYTNKIQESLAKLKILKTKGFGSTILSGLGGAKSVYGIGYTTIRRVVDTYQPAIDNAYKYGGFQSVWSFESPYQPTDNRTEYSSLVTSPKIKVSTVDKNLINKSGKFVNKFAELDSAIAEVNNAIEKPYRISLKGRIDQYENHKKLNGPSTPKSPYRPKFENIDKSDIDLINRKSYQSNLYAKILRAKTGKKSDVNDSPDQFSTPVSDLEKLSNTSLYKVFDTNSKENSKKEITLPNSDVLKPNPFNRINNDGKNTLEARNVEHDNIRNYATMAYNKIPNKKTVYTIPNDFRNDVAGNNSFIGKQDSNYYKNNNLEGKYGFSKATDPTVPARGEGSFIVEGQRFGDVPRLLFDDETKRFRGDKLNGIDIIKLDKENKGTELDKIYEKAGAHDFIKFYFADGDTPSANSLKNIMIFRATITGLSETFSPSWDSVQIMGRPDSAYRYSSFERSISFNFKVAAMSRSEMIPMWRKLNYLASYTMPDWSTGKAGGPFMRLTLGDLYQNCPGFIESLSFTYPDDGTWDIADDLADQPDAKQLPTVVEVSMGYKIIGTYRPQNMGRVFALSKNDTQENGPGQWLNGTSKYDVELPLPPDPDPEETKPMFR